MFKKHSKNVQKTFEKRSKNEKPCYTIPNMFHRKNQLTDIKKYVLCSKMVNNRKLSSAKLSLDNVT